MLTMVASGAMPLNVDRFGIRLCTNNSRHHCAVTVAIFGAVAGEHVVASGNEMGKEAMARHAGVDDGDGLPCPARELPDLLQIEAIASCPAAAISASAGGAAAQRSCCSVGCGGAGGPGLGNIESSTGGGVTADTGGALKRGKAARPPATQSRTICVTRVVMAGSHHGSARKALRPNTRVAQPPRARDTPTLRPFGARAD